MCSAFVGVVARAGGCRDVLLCVVELPVFVGVVTGFCVGFAPCVSFVFVGVWAAGFRGVLWFGLFVVVVVFGFVPWVCLVVVVVALFGFVCLCCVVGFVYNISAPT